MSNLFRCKIYFRIDFLERPQLMLWWCYTLFDQLLLTVQEKSGPGRKPASAVWGGAVWAGEAALWFSDKTLPRHVSPGTAADLHFLAHTAPWAHLYLNAHLFGQPPELGHHLALCLAWTGRFEKLCLLLMLANFVYVKLWRALNSHTFQVYLNSLQL